MREFRNVKVFDTNINDVIKYLEINNKKPTLIITKLPDFKRENDNLGRIATTSMLIQSIDNNRNKNLLHRLFNICNDNCHCYIFTNEEKLVSDYEYMTRAGFMYHNILVYRTKTRSKRDRVFKNNLGYILFFTKENNYLYLRSTNRINGKEPTNFIDLDFVNIEKDYPKRIVDRIINMSKLNKLDENLVVDLQSENGIVPKVCLENSLECVCLTIGKRVNRKLSTYLTGINNKKKVRVVEKEGIKDYSEKNKKISKSMKKTLLKNKIKEIKEKNTTE